MPNNCIIGEIPCAKYNGFPIISGDITMVDPSGCWEYITVCTDVNRCTISHTYAPVSSDCPPQAGHWRFTYKVATPCVSPPNGNPTFPTLKYLCIGKDKYIITYSPSGDETQRLLFLANDPLCDGGDIPPPTACTANPGDSPGSGYFSNPSGTPDFPDQYQYSSNGCWRLLKLHDVTMHSGPGLRDLMAHIIFGYPAIYTFDLLGTDLASLNGYILSEVAPATIANRTLATNYTIAGGGAGFDDGISKATGLIGPIPVTMTGNDEFKETTAYFKIRQGIFGEILDVGKLWALSEYASGINNPGCGGPTVQYKQGLWPFVKTYFPLYVVEALVSQRDTPLQGLTTHTLPGGVTVILPTEIPARVTNSYYVAGDKLQVPQHFMDAGCSITPIAFLVGPWDYLRAVYTPFSATIRVPRCITGNDDTIYYRFNVTFSVPEALNADKDAIIANDNVAVDLLIKSPGCPPYNVDGTHGEIIVYDYPLTNPLTYPTAPTPPPPPTPPTPPADPKIKIQTYESWINAYSNVFKKITHTKITRGGYPTMYSRILEADDLAYLANYDDATYPTTHPKIPPPPYDYFWQEPSLEYPLAALPDFEVGDANIATITIRLREFSAFQWSMRNAYTATVQALNDYTVLKTAYQAQLVTYQGLLDTYNVTTLPAYNVLYAAFRQQELDYFAQTSVGVGLNPNDPLFQGFPAS